MKRLSTVGVMFFIFGVAFLAISILLFIQSTPPSDSVETTAVITDIDSYISKGETIYDVFVIYKVDGVTYTSELNYYDSFMYEGKEITVYYKPQNPEKVWVSVNNISFILMMSIPLVFIIVGICLFGKYFKHKKQKDLLSIQGKRIDAKFDYVDINTSVRVNRRYPYIIHCSWTDPATGKQYRFRSEYLWTNPEFLISERRIGSFIVIIDPKDFTKYYMPLQELAK